MLNDVMLHTNLEKWKNSLSYLAIYTGQHMPIGINNSVLYRWVKTIVC